jgi:hypothetical protein
MKFLSLSYPTYHALTDISTNAILICSIDLDTLKEISACTLNTDVWTLPNPNFISNMFLRKLSREVEPFRYMYDNVAKKIVSSGQLKDNLIEKAKLATLKFNCASEILITVSNLRHSTNKHLPYQDTLYIYKVMEANDFLSKGGLALDYPLLFQYAEIEKVSPEVGAKEILDKNKLYRADQARSEYARLKYMKLIKEAKNIEECIKVIAGFRNNFLQMP